MASSNPTISKLALDEEALDPVLASIRKIEAIRDFACNITPLRSDGLNLHSWVGELDKTLSDLIDRERYLRGSSPEPFVNSEDKIARNLIYWTIPRELRPVINDTTTAHDAFKALRAQFLRNTRACHMADLVDLFNFQTDITQAHHITMLYDQMYKAMNELVASGFVINQDSLLGALFQIAVGRANSQLYIATSHFLDTQFGTEQHSISSQEVCAAARRQLEHWHNTIFDEGPKIQPSEIIDSAQPSEAQNPSPTAPSANSLNQQLPVEHPTAPEPPQQCPASGSSHTRVEPSVVQSMPSLESSSTFVNQATSSAPKFHQTANPSLTGEPSKSSNIDLAGKSNQIQPTAPVARSLFGLNQAASDLNLASLPNSCQTLTSNAPILPSKSSTLSPATHVGKGHLFGKPTTK